ncbi:uncharacterized protein [Nicotiana sylvestris]|uniref:uncharacterized protein n=1 Tax=Nicotiana sylvestris TaxID=4096 RepID=UPI00388C3AC9
MRRSRSANNLLPFDPEIERTLHRLRREVDARTKIERELDIEVQPQPIEMVGNEERAVIEAARPSLANMTHAIVKPDITGHFELKQYMVQLIQATGLFVAKEWLNKEPANSIRTWDDLARKFLIKFFPTKKTKVLRSQILGFEQRVGETLRQAWERYKKMLRDCPHHCQMDEVLGHTFVDGLDDASNMNLDSACGGSCMARPYSGIQILLYNFTANDNNWQGEGDSRKTVKQKSAGLLELDEVSAMRADIAKLANQMTQMIMQQPQTMQHVQQMNICCKLYGDSHMSDMCPTNPESIYYVGQQNRGPPNQNAQYGNSYNPNWRNHPNFSWGGNQQSRISIDPKGISISLKDHPNKWKKQLRTDFRNLERQMGQLATTQNTRPAGALPSDTEKNPQVNAVTLKNGRELEEMPKKKKDKPIPKRELIPKVTQEQKNAAEVSEPVEAPRPPPPFP